MKCLVLCILGLLFCVPGRTATADLQMPPLNHRAWTKADGAPSGIRNIAQSADGTLWLASSHGLFRFDGLRFIRYDGPANQRFASNNVAALTALPSRT